MNKFIVSAFGLLCCGLAQASTVQLVNTTPGNGVIGVKYQMLCQQGGNVSPCGDSKTTELSPSVGVAIPADKLGLRVTALQYHLIKTPDHWVTLPSDQCQWLVSQGADGSLRFATTEHSIGCSH
jgi:hypothetical protein